MRTSFVAAVLALVACGGSTEPTAETPAVLAVNGASLPLLHPGEAVAVEGRGFGSATGTLAFGSDPVDVATWSNTTILTTAPANAGAGITVTTATGAALGPFATRMAPVDTVTTDSRAWAEGDTAPQAFLEASAAGITFPDGEGYRGIVVLFGGRIQVTESTTTLTDSTWIGIVGTDGGIADWRTASDTVEPPRARRLHAMLGASTLTSRLGADGVAWTIGGLDTAGLPITEVLGISIGADGSYGFWTPLAPLPGGRAAVAAAAGRGALYVIGGFGPDSLASRDVLMATVNEPGTITGWFAGPDLPEGVAFAAAAVHGNWLYVTGGQTGLIDPDGAADPASLRNTVYGIRLNPRSGSFADTGWTVLPVMVHARSRHAVFASDGALTVTGGLLADSTGTDTEWAPLVADTVGAFRERTAAARPGGAVRNAASPVIRDAAGRLVVTVIGGTGAGGATDRVWWH